MDGAMCAASNWMTRTANCVKIMRTGSTFRKRRIRTLDDRLFIVMTIMTVALAILGYFIGKSDGYHAAMEMYINIMNKFATSMDVWVQKDEGTEES